MINYIVSIYVGNRGNGAVNRLTADSTYMAKRHLDLLSRLNVPMIKRATFVVSPSSFPEKDNAAVEFIMSHYGKIPGIEIDSFIGENNNNHSYGSWNFGMMKYINEDLNFFLIEDDYFPSKDEFYLPFIEKMSDNIAYVPQLYVHNREHRRHAAISNGLMNIKAARKHYETFGCCINIKLPDKRVYDAGVYTQLYFLKGLEELGYKIDDVSKKYCHPFLERNNKIKLYGNENVETLIEPVFYEDNIRSTYKVAAK